MESRTSKQTRTETRTVEVEVEDTYVTLTMTALEAAQLKCVLGGLPLEHERAEDNDLDTIIWTTYSNLPHSIAREFTLSGDAFHRTWRRVPGDGERQRFNAYGEDLF